MYVRGYMNQLMPFKRYFHGIAHTAEVVNQCEELAQIYDVPWTDAQTLFLAAWFHDLGYADGHEDHENRSVSLALTFLQDFSLPIASMEVVKNLIYATRKPYAPLTLLEKIICDANASYMASPAYLVWSQMRKQEMEAFAELIYKEKEWHARNIDMFLSHRYFTDHARLEWNKTKVTNFETIKHLVVDVIQ